MRKALFALLFALPAILTAQEVLFTAPGFISIAGVPAIYNGKYAIQKTDFGFLWLDTETLTANLVQVEAKCFIGQPIPDTNIYVTGDCNGITNVSTSGNVVVARQLSGQCGAATDGCNGPRVQGTGFFTFRLGTFEYLGSGADIPNSTQMTDLQGRTWVVQSVDNGGRNYKWKASGNPTSPPVASATATNLSAASRADKANYYGDRWQLQDASGTGPPVTRIDWDFNYTGSFAPDETGTPATEATVAGYFPCDPSGFPAGNFRNGTNCMQSLGLSNPPSSNSYRFAMQSANANGTSPSPFVFPPTTFSCPQANIAAYTGSTGTCSKVAGTLSLLTGGSADASGSTGNLFEAFFQWDFTGSGPVSLQGPVVTVPAGATAFTLAITYPGGYRATAQGSVSQTTFVGAFGLSPNPVVVNSPLTLTNQMQKGATATLTSVDYLINPGGCGPPPPIGTNPLGGNFRNATGGQATVTSPSTAGAYCIYLRFNYTSSGTPLTQTVSTGFTVTNWSPAPQIAISPAPFCLGGPCQLQSGTTYSLTDGEPIPVAPHPGATWDLLAPGGPLPIGSTADAANPVFWTPGSACSSCTLRVTVNGVVSLLAVVITPPVGPPPCTTNATTLCLNGGRFKVQVAWATSDGRNGAGQAGVLTGDTGYFWFFSANNIEMVVKVVDGTGFNSRFWVFAGGLTNVNVVLTVTDTKTGAVKTYTNPQQTAFQPIQDTNAFAAGKTVETMATAPGRSLNAAAVSVSTELSRLLDRRASTPPRAIPASALASEDAPCSVTATNLCLNASRFKVEVTWKNPDGSTGLGQSNALTGDTGYFWFFSANNIEMVIKVVDGRPVNSRFWVFAGGLTNVNVVITVTDTTTGAVKTYTNPQGTAFQPIQDTDAFSGP